MTNDFKDKNKNFVPRLSKEEYREKKKQELQNAYGVIDTEISEMMSNPDKFREYLDNQSRLDRYSATNVVLGHPIKFCVNNNPSSNNKTADCGVIRLSDLPRVNFSFLSAECYARFA